MKPFGLVLVTTILVFFLDRIFGLLVPGLLANLNDGSHLSSGYPSNPNGYFRHSRVDSNGSSFYVVERGAPQPAPAFPEIVAIGDSFTWGQGVYPEDTWPMRLGRLMNTDKVVNLARSGANVAGALEQLRLVPSKTKLVIYGYVLNDPLFSRDRRIHQMKQSPPRPNRDDAPFHWDFMNVRPREIRASRGHFWRVLGERSNIIDYCLSILELRRASEATVQFYKDIHDPSRNREGLERTWATFETMRDEAKKRGFRFLVVVFPVFYRTEQQYPFQDVHRFVSGELSRRGISVLDLLPTFTGRAANSFWVHSLDQHPNHIAHGAAAETIYRYLNLGGDGRQGRE